MNQQRLTAPWRNAHFLQGRSVSISESNFQFAAPKPSPLLINFRGNKNFRAVKAHYAKPQTLAPICNFS